MKFARNGGTLFHHNQLLLTLLMPVECKRCGQLLNQGINQLLLIVAQMATSGQGGQQKPPGRILLYPTVLFPAEPTARQKKA